MCSISIISPHPQRLINTHKSKTPTHPHSPPQNHQLPTTNHHKTELTPSIDIPMPLQPSLPQPIPPPSSITTRFAPPRRFRDPFARHSRACSCALGPRASPGRDHLRQLRERHGRQKAGWGSGRQKAGWGRRVSLSLQKSGMKINGQERFELTSYVAFLEKEIF